jgi:hypothetical protein
LYSLVKNYSGSHPLATIPKTAYTDRVNHEKNRVYLPDPETFAVITSITVLLDLADGFDAGTGMAGVAGAGIRSTSSAAEASFTDAQVLAEEVDSLELSTFSRGKDTAGTRSI